MLEPSDIVARILPHRTPQVDRAACFAPANIALCKYWGKRNEALKLPLTGSLSVALGDLGTRMELRLGEEDRLILDGTEQAPGSKVFTRLFSFLNLFRETGTCFEIRSENSIPMGAGLASSASAFAAAVKSLDQLFGWDLSEVPLSVLARLGSGSASRSLYPGFAEWIRGERDDGMDSYAVPLSAEWPGFRVGILKLSEAEKAVGSGEGMKRTMETSGLYPSWPAQVERDLPRIRQAVEEQDFDRLGAAAEQNALSMHATMISAWPPILYWRPESVEALHRVQELRRNGVQVYATMDAGPNVKLLFLQPQTEELRRAFPGLEIVAPFD